MYSVENSKILSLFDSTFLAHSQSSSMQQKEKTLTMCGNVSKVRRVLLRNAQVNQE